MELWDDENSFTFAASIVTILAWIPWNVLPNCVVFIVHYKTYKKQLDKKYSLTSLEMLDNTLSDGERNVVTVRYSNFIDVGENEMTQSSNPI